MDDILTLRSTSLNSAVGRDIVLRETNSTRLIFRPELVDNPHNQKACVRGHFIFQRKKISGSWEDHKDFSLSKLKDSEWIQLELKAGELYELIIKLNNYFAIFSKYGISLGEATFTVTPNNAKSVFLQLLENPIALDKLKDLSVDDLKRFNAASNLSSLRKTIDFWEENKTNGDESCWQTFFKDNSWILAQVFSYPVILFKEKAYLGGKGLDNTGGSVVDFIYKNNLTNNVLVVEIKTPTTLVMGGHYRDHTYSLSGDLSGSLIQTLRYKDTLYKNYSQLTANVDAPVQVFNPKCLIVIGKIQSEEFSIEEKRASFELFRNDSRQIEVITFDELFGKVQLLITLLEN